MPRSPRGDTPAPSSRSTSPPRRATFYLMDGYEEPVYLMNDYWGYSSKARRSRRIANFNRNCRHFLVRLKALAMAVTSSAYWALVLMGCIYMIGELGHFLIGPVSRYMAQDMEYGDRSCLPKMNLFDSDSSAELCTDTDSQIRCDNLTVLLANGTEVLGCSWDFNGLGIEYQILAGPSFIAVFTVAGLGWGYLADKFNRVKILSLSALIFSVSIAGTAIATKYWHVVLFRMALAAGEAGCSPLASGIIADIFPASQRGLAMSLFNWGIYIGYGFSYTVGNYVTDADIFGQGWRASYVISGLPGILIALTFLLTVKEPPRTNENGEIIDKKGSLSDVKYDTTGVSNTTDSSTDQNKSAENVSQASQDPEKLSDNEDGSDLAIVNLSSPKNLKKTESSVFSGWSFLKNPAMILLAVGACIRHFAGYTWGYNSALYFQTYYPNYDASWWLTGISIGAGAVGAAMGGYLSDRLVSRLGISARALVLAISQLIAVPFAFGLLFLDPPLAMFSLLLGYMASEMWFGVMFAVLVELVPSDVRSKAIAIILFIINNFGGNVPVIVDPIAAKYGYRTALAILYPGALITSSILFFVCWMILRIQHSK